MARKSSACILAHQEHINAQEQDYQTGVAAWRGEKKPQEIAETGD